MQPAHAEGFSIWDQRSARGRRLCASSPNPRMTCCRDRRVQVEWTINGMNGSERYRTKLACSSVSPLVVLSTRLPPRGESRIGQRRGEICAANVLWPDYDRVGSSPSPWPPTKVDRSDGRTHVPTPPGPRQGEAIDRPQPAAIGPCLRWLSIRRSPAPANRVIDIFPRRQLKSSARPSHTSRDA